MPAEPPVCGANRPSSSSSAGCPFAPTAHVTFTLPPGHEHGYPDRPAEVATYSCAVHLEVLVPTIEGLGVTPEVERIHPDGMVLQ